MQILEAGGNAVDAAIATAFADSVMQPASSGIGGGGAALVVADGQARSYDYREVVNAAGVVPPSGTGIPGFVAGLDELHREYATLPWAALLQPAIDLARTGAPVSRYLARTINSSLGQRVTGALPQFRNADGAPLQEGDLLVQQELATTMAALAEQGPRSFYTGELAQTVVGVEGVDASSLAAYTVQASEPPRGRVGDYTMISASPALPGAAIIQMVQIAEAAGIGRVPAGSAEFVDLQSRAWQVAERSVQSQFGDPAFVQVPTEALTDPAANAALARDLPPAVFQETGQSYDGAPNTTHISVVDANGMAVSMTNTITNYWGSGQYVAGFFLNDQLERFQDIGAQGANNPPLPGRRSVTWSSPSMLLDDRGRPALVIGTPGGRQIPNTTAQVIMLWALQRVSLDDAVRTDRFILADGVLRLESERLRTEMTALGYPVRVHPSDARADWGSIQALQVNWDERTVSGVADDRRSAGVETAVEAPRQPAG
ncbi:gamma-glutamyltransferase [Cellulomonas marina]|uniref:Gamma-glutamyltranspeptidase / glutathione hydrolase n=1 Tax=Cellulomonas marina TaxID=988821 RepID=A0A1I0YY97_9CELL|nr:gamma-glutamyltransferase [Cellulomonas marina]GIG28104.1 gamma-glutamyltranspeptidase [Cellulomonas marina]SFB18251.1 gamma-glutamyltranspeptidase / glutathione hydrolase [Cellulomonas marina]